MKWREDPLFAYVEGNGGYQKPGHPDHEPKRFNWFITVEEDLR